MRCSGWPEQVVARLIVSATATELADEHQDVLVGIVVMMDLVGASWVEFPHRHGDAIAFFGETPPTPGMNCTVGRDVRVFPGKSAGPQMMWVGHSITAEMCIGRALTSTRQRPDGEAFVVVLNELLQSIAVGTHSGHVEHHSDRLAFDVGAIDP